MTRLIEWVVDEDGIVPPPSTRHELPPLRKRRLLKLGGLSAAALLAASLSSHPSHAKPDNDDNTGLINASTTVYFDRGEVYDGGHELVEMNCLFRPSLGGLRPDVGNIQLHGLNVEGYVTVAKPFAVQLAHPNADNFAIIYTGLNDIDELQHFNVQTKGEVVHIEADTPEFPGYGASSKLLSENVQLGNGRVIEGRSGLVRYAVGEWSGKFTVALACDTAGSGAMVAKEPDRSEFLPVVNWNNLR